MWQGPNLQDDIIIMILLYDIIQEAWECDLGVVISEDCWEDCISDVRLNLIQAVPQNYSKDRLAKI